jgi:hypothetical protein
VFLLIVVTRDPAGLAPPAQVVDYPPVLAVDFQQALVADFQLVLEKHLIEKT